MRSTGTMFEAVLARVQAEFGVTRAQLLAPTRSSRDIAWARQVAVHLCHRLSPSTSWSELGRWFGRDRTTMRHAHELVDDIRGQGEDLNDKLEEIERVCSTAAICT
jgi:chromosomal replication initiation ATPase DnaA